MTVPRGEQREQSTEAQWADIELAVPNKRSQLSIGSFVECVLVGLTMPDSAPHDDTSADYTATIRR